MVTLDQIRTRLIASIRESGLTQTEIAKRLGIKQQTVQKYIASKAMPALDTLANLCAVLDVSADYLLGLEDETGAKTYIRDSFNNFTNNGNIKF